MQDQHTDTQGIDDTQAAEQGNTVMLVVPSGRPEKDGAVLMLHVIPPQVAVMYRSATQDGQDHHHGRTSWQMLV